MIPIKIVSGGQAGADRAGLDWAMARDITHGGWCPRGRLSEDGGVPSRYNLQETSSRKYPPRTQRNVAESDGTVVFTLDRTVGIKKTLSSSLWRS